MISDAFSDHVIKTAIDQQSKHFGFGGSVPTPSIGIKTDSASSIFTDKHMRRIDISSKETVNYDSPLVATINELKRAVDSFDELLGDMKETYAPITLPQGGEEQKQTAQALSAGRSAPIVVEIEIINRRLREIGSAMHDIISRSAV